MLSRIVVAGLLIFAAMVAIQQGALRQVGLTGSCRAAETLTDRSQWVACKPGALEGRPSLASKSCTSGGVSGKVEWWHCPAPIVSTAVGR